LFSGIGGFDLGLEAAGWACAFQVEIDPFCTKVLERRWPDVRRYRDIRTVEADALRAGTARLPDGRQRPGGQQRGAAGGGPGREGEPPGGGADGIDLLCGGFPCQDLSVAGRRAGLAGARSGLFFEFVRVATELRPRWVLLENVPGLLSSNGGRDFAVVLAALGDAGYGVGWRVLDARWFGVPQRRRRVFLVGHLGGPCPAAVLFEPEGVLGDLAAGREAGQDVAYPIAAGAGGSKFGSGRDSQDTFITASHDTSPPLMAEGFDASEDGRGRKAFAFTCKDSGQDAGEEAPTLRAMGHDQSHANGGGQLAVAFDHTHDPVSSASAVPTLNEDGQAVAVTSGPRMWDDRGIHRGTVSTEVTPTLNGYEQPMVLPAVRRLTPTECERLQAFPDGFTCLCGVEPYSTWACRCPDGPRYAALGNAVTTTVVEWIGRRIIRALWCSLYPLAESRDG
jgi:DNA (cytosine-5)-methyltransferase 1